MSSEPARWPRGYVRETTPGDGERRHGHVTRSVVVTRLAQATLLVAAAASVTWACTDPTFRDAEGYLEGTVCLPLSVGIGLVVIAAGLATRLQTAASWFALALVGQAVALQSIEAGPLMRYQHYATPARLVSERSTLVLMALLQTGLVWAALRTRWAHLWLWLRAHFKPWQLATMAALIIAPSAAVSPTPAVYVAEVALATYVQALNLATLVLMIAAIPSSTVAALHPRLERLLRGPQSGWPLRSCTLPVVAALWVGLLSTLLSVYSYERHPHIPDEVAYIYQARFLASGVLTMPTPPVPRAFEFYLMHFDGDRWYPSPPVGWPAVLALGEWAGVPWLVNPVLAGLAILLAYALLKEIYDARTARGAVLLMAVSPWYVFMGMNFMTHMLILASALAAAVALARARRMSSTRWSVLGGFAIGVLSLTRPLEGAIMAALLALWLIGVGTWRARARCLVAFGIGTTITGGLVFLYNHRLTGHMMHFPINVYTDQHFGPNSNAYGFGPDRGMGWPIDPWPGHSPLDALVNANLNGFSINVELFGWATGSLLFVALLVVSKSLRRSDYLMLVVIAAIFTAYFFYYFSGGPDFGARYWFLMLVPLVALTVRGAEFLATVLERSGVSGAQVRLAVAALSMLTLANYFPWRAIDKYHHYLGMRPDIRELAHEFGFGRSLVLIRGDGHPDYASAAVYNPVDLYADEPVYAWDRDPQSRAAVLTTYSDRTAWVVEGPSITDGPYRIVAGPLLPGLDLPEREHAPNAAGRAEVQGTPAGVE